MGQRREIKFLQWAVIAAGAAICCYAILNLPVAQLDWRFLVLSLVLVGYSARLTIQVPQVKAHISFSDTLTFLALLLYGGDAAILLAATEALCSSLRFRRQGVAIKAQTILLNAAVMACSTFLTVKMLRLEFYPITAIPSLTHIPTFVFALGIMALTQYLANSGLVALFTALKSGESFWATWRKHCLWSSVTYFAGAAAAGMLVKVGGTIDFSTMVVTGIIVAFVYFTYRRYIEDIKHSARQAEQAERERAEQAERHIAELNESIEEQKRISRALTESKERFRHAALHDALTELPNRALFTEHLHKAIERSKRDTSFIFAVLFLDFDRFKYVNDSLGHTFGDHLLIEISNRLRECVRMVDTVARFGGDEFAILLDGINSPTLAIHVAERIQQAMASSFNIDGHETFLTTSIGIALSTQGYLQPEEVLRDADIAMYHAKESGKARHQVFDKTMHAQTLSRLNLENDLRRAIERNDFFLVYQPIVHVGSGKLFGFEALVRWKHAERGVVPPMEFIPIAEETGQIYAIGDWVLRAVCKQLRTWLDNNVAVVPVAVNISPKQLQNRHFCQESLNILREFNISTSLIVFELTEGTVMSEDEETALVLPKLQAAGIRIAIDDFGTGFSSFSRLHTSPVDILKIDQSFIRRINDADVIDAADNEAGNSGNVIKAMINMAKALNIRVVAEGVETEAQSDFLRRNHCDAIQGYYISKALSAVEFGGQLRNQVQHGHIKTTPKPRTQPVSMLHITKPDDLPANTSHTPSAAKLREANDTHEGDPESENHRKPPYYSNGNGHGNGYTNGNGNGHHDSNGTNAFADLLTVLMPTKPINPAAKN